MVNKEVIDEPPKIVLVPPKLTKGEKPLVTASGSLRQKKLYLNVSKR